MQFIPSAAQRCFIARVGWTVQHKPLNGAASLRVVGDMSRRFKESIHGTCKRECSLESIFALEIEGDIAASGRTC